MMMRPPQSGQGGGITSSVVGEIAAAKALDWNVELESNLRSGAQVEAATRLGPRLLRLSQEPVVAEITAALYKLEPGQDQVLANAIVRRLADAFQSGSNFIRLCILKVFILEYKGRRKSKARKCSLFTKDRTPNYVEFLRRVKSVLDSGDSTARALALRVIGCLAELASDSVEVYRLVLEALQSPHRLEVEGAFFAMSCLCEVSVAFSAQALKKVTAMVNAMETAPELKRLAIGLFAKMHRSPHLSLDAHEVGRKLMVRLPTEDVVRRVLVALTHLAAQALETMDHQVKLLLCYVSSDPRSTVRAVALNCLNHLAPRATTFHSFTKMDFDVFFSVLGDPLLPTVLHVSAFQVFRKLLHSYVDSADAGDLEELIRLSELFPLYSEWSVRRASLSFLVDLSCTLVHSGSLEMESNQPPHKTNNTSYGPDSGSSWHINLPTRVSLLCCDQLACIFVKQCNMQEKAELSDHGSKDNVSALERCHIVCSLIGRLVHGCPEVGFTVVDYLSGVLEGLATRTGSKTMREKQLDTGPINMDIDQGAGDFAGPVLNDDGGNEKVLLAATLQIVHVVCRLLLACVNMLREQETVHLVCSRLCSLTTSLANSEKAGDILLALLPAVLRAHMNQVYNSSFDKVPTGSTDEVQSNKELSGLSPSSSYAEQLSMNISRVTDEMEKRCKYWAVYKVGELSANAFWWRLAESAFVIVRSKVSSEGSYLWLEALVQVASAEAQVSPYEINGTLPSNCSAQDKKENAGDGMDVDNESATTGITVPPSTSSSTDTDKLLEPFQSNGRKSALNCRKFCAEGAVKCIPVLQGAIQTLAAGVCLERTFEFQRWFLSLRCNMLKRVAELVGLLETGTLDMIVPDTRTTSLTGSHSVLNGTDDSEAWQTASRLQAIAEKADWIASEFRRLSEEFDLLCLSFMGVDTESLQILSRASLSCSLVAFCVVSLLFPKLSRAKREFTSTHVDLGLAAYDLLQRLEQMYGDEWEELTLLCMEYGVFHGTSHSLRTSHGSGRGPLLRLCRWAVSEVVHLSQNVAQEDQLTTRPWLQSQGLSLLKDLLDNWSAIPWQIPRFFFHTRPRTGVEVVAAQLGGSDMSIAAGSALSLGLAFQLVHLPFENAVKSLSCALTVQPAKAAVAVEEDAYAGWRIGRHEGNASDQLFDITLIEELVLREKGWRDKADGGNVESEALARSVVSLSVNESGRGFASCIIDVRKVPCGVYQICLQCVCTDRKGAQWILLSLRNCPTFRIM